MAEENIVLLELLGHDSKSKMDGTPSLRLPRTQKVSVVSNDTYSAALVKLRRKAMLSELESKMNSGLHNYTQRKEGAPMSNTIITRKTFDLGKIDYNGTGRKINAVTVTLELRRCGGDPTFRMVNGTRIETGSKTPEYTELSVCGDIWNSRRTDILCGGQCLDAIHEHWAELSGRNQSLFLTLYWLWKTYHLNGMHAGTPEQEQAVAEWKAAGNRYKYSTVCEMLKERGLYEIPFTGKTVGRELHNEPYKYGHGWVVADLPESVIEQVQALCA